MQIDCAEQARFDANNRIAEQVGSITDDTIEYAGQTVVEPYPTFISDDGIPF